MMSMANYQKCFSRSHQAISQLTKFIVGLKARE